MDGWIPLSLSVDAAVDDAGQERLAELCPNAAMEATDEYIGERGRTTGRGKERTVTRRVRLSFCPQPDKQRAYADSVSGLMADQVAFIGDPSHIRRVTEQNGRASVALAEAAAILAG